MRIPHLYVLHGGFEAFLEKHPSQCTGPSVRRDEAMFAAERRAVAALARDAWRAAGTAASLSRAPDARRFGNGGVHVSAAEHEALERTHEGVFGGGHVRDVGVTDRRRVVFVRTTAPIRTSGIIDTVATVGPKRRSSSR